MRWLVIALLGCSSGARVDTEPARAAPATPRDAAPVATVVASPGFAGADAAQVDAYTVAVVDAPMRWTAEREKLTLEYRRTHSDPDAKDLAIEPRVIVLHYTDGGSATATRAYFDNERVEAARKEIARAGAVNVSAHFVVDRDGTIYQLQPTTRFARHCIGLNHIAIGIENVGDEAKFPLTDAQVHADAKLVRMLAAQYPITHLLGHYEVMSFRTHAYYQERDPSYKNDKPDPGKRFMAAVRAEVSDLGLEGLP